jgi:hypothetical protein
MFSEDQAVTEPVHEINEFGARGISDILRPEKQRSSNAVLLESLLRFLCSFSPHSFAIDESGGVVIRHPPRTKLQPIYPSHLQPPLVAISDLAPYMPGAS